MDTNEPIQKWGTPDPDWQLVYVSNPGSIGKRNVYEFYFSSKSDDACGPYWEVVARGNVQPPPLQYIDAVAVVETSGFQFSLLSESDEMRYLDGVMGFAALAWEFIDDYRVLPHLNITPFKIYFGDKLSFFIKELESRRLLIKWRDPKDNPENEEDLDEEEFF